MNSQGCCEVANRIVSVSVGVVGYWLLAVAVAKATSPGLLSLVVYVCSLLFSLPSFPFRSGLWLTRDQPANN